MPRCRCLVAGALFYQVLYEGKGVLRIRTDKTARSTMFVVFFSFNF